MFVNTERYVARIQKDLEDIVNRLVVCRLIESNYKIDVIAEHISSYLSISSQFMHLPQDKVVMELN